MPYIGKNPTVGNFVKLDAIVTSATATYNLLNGGVAYSPQSANHCIVSLNGVIQSPNTSFTISGSTIVFISALTATDVIDFILVLGDVLNIGTPSDATVGFSKVTSNLITGATAETSIAGGDSVLIYDDSASALRKMTRTNFVAGVGGTNTPIFQATMTADQTLTNNTNTKITFNNEEIDTASNYDAATNYRFTPTTSGKYFISTTITHANNANGARSVILALFKNGSQIYNQFAYSNDSYSQNFITLTTQAIVTLNGSTDYIEAFAKIDVVAGSPDIDAAVGASGGKSSIFQGYKLIE